jgi:hypothetical protein
LVKERQQFFTFAILADVKEYKTYNTASNGPVYVLKKDSHRFGAAGKKIKGVPSIRVKDKDKKTKWIPVDEIIIPSPKKPLTNKQRKAKYDKRLKKEGRKRVSVTLSQDTSLMIDAIQKKTSLSYGSIIEKLLRSATGSKSINFVIKKVFSEEPATQKLKQTIASEI